jgi:hypothetical protein
MLEAVSAVRRADDRHHIHAVGIDQELDFDQPWVSHPSMLPAAAIDDASRG